MACDKCGHIIQIGDFPFCKGSVTDHINPRFGVTGDDIPGGLDVKHGICWPDGTPRRYYSKSAIREAAARMGYTIGGETPKPRQEVVDREGRERDQRNHRDRTV